jgi:hypothetical protein
MYNRLHHYLDQHKLFAKEQHGFRQNASTETAAISLLNTIFSFLAKGNTVLVLLVFIYKPHNGPEGLKRAACLYYTQIYFLHGDPADYVLTVKVQELVKPQTAVYNSTTIHVTALAYFTSSFVNSILLLGLLLPKASSTRWINFIW